MDSTTLRRWFAKKTGLAAALGCSLLASSVEADVKAYHPGMCRPVEEPSPAGTALTYGVSGVFNAGSDPATVTCPLVRDRTGSSSQVDSAYVELYRSNLAGSDPFTCTLYTQDEDVSGSTVDYETESTTSVGDVQLAFSGPATSSGNEGSYSMICSVPEFSYLYHIYVNEESSND
jgi:hypothetical protein